MKQEIYYSAIVDDQLFLPNDLVDYFSDKNNQIRLEQLILVVSRGLNNDLYLFRPEDWEVFEARLMQLSVKNEKNRYFVRFFRGSATDIEIVENKVQLGLLKEWLNYDGIKDRDIDVVLYREERDGYERIVLQLAKEYKELGMR